MTRSPSPSEHAILVFGASVDQHGRPRAPLTRRLRRALVEAATNPEAVIILTGGRVRGRPAEAPGMRDWLVAEGLNVARVVLEGEATSTLENARRSANLIASHGFKRVTLVTERYHVLRARFLLSQALAARGVRIELRTSAAPDDLGAFERIVRYLRELSKLAGDIRQLRQS